MQKQLSWTAEKCVLHAQRQADNQHDSTVPKPRFNADNRASGLNRLVVSRVEAGACG
jgi:hypothetical protein